MEFNERTFMEFKADVQAALREVAKKYEVSIDCGKIRYSDYDFDLNLKVTKNSEDIDGNRLKFEQICLLYGLSKSDYGREFIMDDKKFKLIGFNTRARKNKCQILCLTDGKHYVCSIDYIKQRLYK